MHALRVLAVRLRAGPIGANLWALIDQGVVSLGGAMTSILLARYLSPDAFGVAVLLISGMLFLNTIQSSLVVYPLSVSGARLHGHSFRIYVGNALISTVALAIPLGLVLAAVAAALVSVRTAFIAALALLAWQVQETTRRALFAHLRHRAAIIGDALSYLGQAAIIGVLGMAGALSLPRVFVVMAITSTIGISLQSLQLVPVWRDPLVALRPAIGLLKSGRPALTSNVLGASIMQAPIWMLGLLVGHTEAGSFQAMVAVVGVMSPVMYGVANALIPTVAQRSISHSASLVWRTIVPTLTIGAGLVVPFLLALWIWPAQILGIVYGRASVYSSLAMPLRFLAIAYLMVLLAHIGNAALFGLERPGEVRSVQVVGAVVLLVAGFPVISLWGLQGAVVVVIAAHAVRCLLCARALDRFDRSTAFRPAVVAGQR